MRCINKSSEPTTFERWKQANPAATFDDLGNGTNHALKQAVKNSLIAEQKYICCYCENRIDASSSHIEHLLPRCSHSQKQLDYANLLASCEADGRKSHCGHKKDRQLLPFTPLDDTEISQRFIFAADGNIYPRDVGDNAANTVITILGLDAKRLVTMRNTAISTFIALLTNSPEERSGTLASVSPSSDKLYAFYSAIRYQIGQLVAAPQ